MLLIFTQRLPNNSVPTVDFSLALTAEQRTRSQQSIHLSEGQRWYLRLPRGTVLNEGDLLQSEPPEKVVKILAKPEPVLTVTAANSLDLIRAAYHLGNRHVALEITSEYLRLSPDFILNSMLIQLGLEVTEEVAPFYPERGAYTHHNSDLRGV